MKYNEKEKLMSEKKIELTISEKENDKEKLIKELYEQQEDYDYWLMRTESSSYDRWPDNVFIDDRRIHSYFNVGLLIEKLNIDEIQWRVYRKIVYL